MTRQEWKTKRSLKNILVTQTFISGAVIVYSEIESIGAIKIVNKKEVISIEFKINMKSGETKIPNYEIVEKYKTIIRRKFFSRKPYRVKIKRTYEELREMTVGDDGTKINAYGSALADHKQLTTRLKTFVEFSSRNNLSSF